MPRPSLRPALVALLCLALAACGARPQAAGAPLVDPPSGAAPAAPAPAGGDGAAAEAAADAPGVLWSIDAEAGTALALQGDLLYFVDTWGVVHAVGRESGAEQWAAPTGLDVVRGEDLEPYAPPLVAADAAVFATDETEGHTLKAVDPLTGGERWSVALPGTGGRLRPGIRAAGSRYYVRGHADLYAVDAPSGQLLWSRPASTDPALVDGAAYGVVEEGGVERLARLDDATGEPAEVLDQYSPIRAVAGALVFAGCLDVYDVATGQPAWRPGLADDAVCRSITVDGDLVLADVDEEFNRQVPGLFAFDLATGAPRWQIPIPNEEAGATLATPPIVVGAQVVLITTQGEVLAVDRGSGTPLWQTAIEYEAGYDYPEFFAAVDGETLIVGNSFGPDMVGLDLATGERRWAFPNAVTRPMLLADGRLYIATQREIISLSLRGEAPSAPAPAADGTAASVTITAILECGEQSASDCGREPIEALFAISQGGQPVERNIVVRVAANPISLPPGTYTVEATDPLYDPAVVPPPPQEITVAAGDAVTLTFTFVAR